MDRQKVLNEGERIIGDEEDWNARMHRAQYRWVIERVKTLSEHRGVQPGVLDFGCGSGYGTKMLTDSLTGRDQLPRVFGSDVDGTAIQWAREHNQRGVGYNPFILVSRPPLASELARWDIDIVVCMGVLEHLPLRPVHYILEWLKAGVSIIGAVPLAEPAGRNPFHYHSDLHPGDILPQEDAAGLDVEWYGFVALEDEPKPLTGLTGLIQRDELFERGENDPYIVSLLFCITQKRGPR